MLTISWTLTAMVFATRAFTLSSDRTSTWMGVASPPADVISRATVVMVESLDFGLGVLSESLEGSVMDFAATTTGRALVSTINGKKLTSKDLPA